jgi:hypothetical protein
MIERGELEALEDFEHDGVKVLASRLGYRITERFVHTYFGRVFDNPVVVFTEELLKPEIQDVEAFVDGVNNIVEAQQRSAQAYFEDGTVEDACPPLRAILHIMAHGHFEGKDARHPEIRALFTREAMLDSDWYRERLLTKQRRDVALWKRHVDSLTAFANKPGYAHEARRLHVEERLELARHELAHASSPEYVHSLEGTLGADPIRAAGVETTVTTKAWADVVMN